MKISQITTCVAIWAVGLVACSARAQVPVDTTFTYQGQLQRGAVPVSGLCDFRFQLYSALTGGSQVGVTRTIAALPVTNGLFSVELSFGAGVFTGDERFLQAAVQCVSDVALIPLSPRQRLTAAPYASTALKTVGVDGHSLDASDGSPTDVVRVDSTGKVWMEKGGLTIFDDQGHGISLTSDEFSFIEGSSEDPVYDYSSATDTHRFWTNGTRRMVIAADGKVGVGTTAPAALLHLGGVAGVDGLMFPDGTLQTTAAMGGGANSLWTASADDIFYNTGNVGVGEENPSATLHIVGPPEEGAVVKIDTVGGDATALEINATGYPGFGIVATATDTAVFGSSPIEGGTFYASGVGGRGLAGIANAATGDGKGVYGRTNSSEGYAGYFEGRSYFSGDVGIGQSDPQTTLHLGGIPGSDGIMFPDGTLQTTAATGGGGGSLWSQAGSDIFYTAGRVGIGTSAPQSKLQLAGANANLLMLENGGSPFLAVGDDTTTVGWLQWGSSNDELDIYTYGHNYPIAIGPTSSGGLFVDTGTNSGNVGIGTSAPGSKLHIVGPNDPINGPILTLAASVGDRVESGRIRFGESTGNLRGAFLHYDGLANELHIGTHQAATSDPADDVNMITLQRVTERVGINNSSPLTPFHVVGTTYMEGRVGIGTIPSEDLHVAGDSRFDGNIGIGTAPGTFSPLQIATDTLVGLKASTTFPIAGVGIWGESTADNGETRGVYGSAASPDGVGVYGESDFAGVQGTGGTYGVRGIADGSVGFSFGVSGTASTESGRGVTAYNSATTGNPIAIWGGTATLNGFGGFFQGRGYFRDAVTIGGTSALANKLTVRDDPFHSFDLFSGIGVRDHTALIENEHTPGILQTTGVLALRANWPVGGSINYITFYQKDPQSSSYEQVGNIRGDGSGGVVLESAGSDYAEWLPVLDCEEEFEPGDIVGVIGGHITKDTYGANHVMVISTAPIVLGNQPPDGGDEHDGFQKIAFIGQAPVKVLGPVVEGDFIIPSGLIDGTGVGVSPEVITSEQFAQVIGQAWEGSDGFDLRRVRTAIGQLPPDPTVARMASHIQKLQRETETVKNEAVALRARLASLEAIVAKLAGDGNGGE